MSRAHLGRAFAALLLAFASFASHAAADPQETRKLHALFDASWENTMRRSPDFATELGDLRYNDRWPDESAAGRAAADREQRDELAQARTIRRERLSGDDRVSLDVFVQEHEDAVAGQAFPGYRSMLIGALWGPQSQLADAVGKAPMNNEREARQLLARFAAYPTLVDQEVAHMREGLAAGWVPARSVLDLATSQIDHELAAAPDESPWFEAFKRIGADVPAAVRDQLQAAARDSIARGVVPSVRKLRAFIVDELEPKAPAEGSLGNYPGGAKVYQWLVRSRTTTGLTAQQVHEIGLKELASLHVEMEAAMRAAKFQGSFAQFVHFLNTDPKFFYTNSEDLLAGYRAVGKRLDAQLPRFFAVLPRATWGVRAMPSFRGPGAAEYYDRPPVDNSRPGWFNANALAFASRPKWGMATLTAHEAVPGHHLQTARAQEIAGLPKFRRYSWYVAYGEGWAVYAESLAREMGIYDDPYSLFGHLQYRAFRAARLVVDTGIHSMGWTRQRAIDFMVDQTGMDRGFMSAEVDRYISDPGQALGYMIGALEFRRLREHAKAELGDRFDLRRFHNAVLDDGPLPLGVLETVVDEWIAREQAR